MAARRHDPTATAQEQPRPHIACCFAGCLNPANARLWTATGWVNVCAYVGVGDKNAFHYTKVKTVPRITHNYIVDAVRAAHEQSGAFA